MPTRMLRLFRSSRGAAFLRLAVSGLLLAWLLRQVAWTALWAQMRHVDAAWLGLALLSTVAAFVFTTWRWRAVLQALGLDAPPTHLLAVVLITFFWNHFLPTTVGGDGYRFLWLRGRFPGRDKAAAAGIFLDRLVGYWALMLVHVALLGGLALTGQPLPPPMLLAVDAAVLAAALAVPVVWFGPWPWARWAVRFPLPQGWRQKVAQGLAGLTARPRVLTGRTLAYAVLFVLAQSGLQFAYLRALGARPPLPAVLYAATLGALLGVLPVSLNGLGVFEGVMVGVLEPLGWPREQILAAAFLARGVNLLLALLGGLLYALAPPGRQTPAPDPHGKGAA